MTSPVVRVLYAALLSRLLVLLLAVLADLHVTDYDTSGRYDVPNTSTRCQLSDGDEKTPQARGHSSTMVLSSVSAEQPPHLCVLHLQKDPLLRSFCRVVQVRAVRATERARYRPLLCLLLTRAVLTAQGQACLGFGSLCPHRAVRLRDGEVARVLPSLPGSHARRARDRHALPHFPAWSFALSLTHATLILCAVLRSALPVLYPRCTLALSGLLLSNVCFVLAALALFWLSCLTVRDGDLALRAALLFCFNPASIFFSSVYTESLFAFLSWAGALSLAVDSPWRAAVAFSAAAATRSNGACMPAKMVGCIPAR